MTYLKTNLEGKVRNLPHFKSEALLPVFEAVVNSIQAIEERGNVAGGTIDVRIVREAQRMLGDIDDPKISGFVITDNGIGFNEGNFDSFETSDSDYKKALGGKGVGRFLWLKAFDNVRIESIYRGNGKRMKRVFTFTTQHGIKTIEHVAVTGNKQYTIVRLNGFKKEYRALPSAFKTTAKIAQRILEHCLSYFISGEVPRITVVDEEESFVLNDMYEKDIRNNLTEETIHIGGQIFAVAHIKLYGTHDKMHNAVLCANSRDVKRLGLAKVLGTNTPFDDNNRKFTYAIYVTSDYLDQRADNYRLDFDIPEDDTMFVEDGAITMKQIERAVAFSARDFLYAFLQQTQERKQELVANYVANENPALRAVPHYCPEVFDELEPNSTPEKVNEVLYRHKGRAELEIRKQSDTLLKTQGKSLEEVEESYRSLTSQINEFQKETEVDPIVKTTDREK